MINECRGVTKNNMCGSYWKTISVLGELQLKWLTYHPCRTQYTIIINKSTAKQNLSSKIRSCLIIEYDY